MFLQKSISKRDGYQSDWFDCESQIHDKKHINYSGRNGSIYQIPDNVSTLSIWYINIKINGFA